VVRPNILLFTVQKAIAFEIEIQSLKQMRQIRDSITAPLGNFDFVDEVFHKAAAEAVDEAFRNLLHPVLQGLHETLNAAQYAANALHPSLYRRGPSSPSR
jgi:hypothetical protein